MPDTMRILCLACPHGDDGLLNIPLDDIDLVLIAGDIGKADKIRELRMRYPNSPSLTDKVSKNSLKEMIEENIESAEKILKYFSQRPTYLIFGNADNTKDAIEYINRKHSFNIKPLENRTRNKNIKRISEKIVILKDIKIAGLDYFVEMSWIINFLGKDNHRTINEKIGEEKAANFLSKLGYVDILVCHQPPYGFLDKVDNPIVPKNWNGKRAGSKLILDYIKKWHPRYVICGHIHEGNGRVKVGTTTVINTAKKWVILDL